VIDRQKRDRHNPFLFVSSMLPPPKAAEASRKREWDTVVFDLAVNHRSTGASPDRGEAKL
jgi:hypothetical protein